MMGTKYLFTNVAAKKINVNHEFKKNHRTNPFHFKSYGKPWPFSVTLCGELLGSRLCNEPFIDCCCCCAANCSLEAFEES